VRDIRNLARVDLELPADGIAIVGDNGQGKTNVLEAIAYLHLLRSVRGARDTDVVRFGARGGSITGEAVRSDRPAAGATRTVTVGFDRQGRRKRVTIDGAPAERLSDGFGAVPSVAIAPTDVDLVRGGPEERRRYLDIVLATTSPAYLAALQRYRAALVRRNAVLREMARRTGVRGGAGAEDAAAVWEPQLAEAGAIVRGARLAWVARWEGELARLTAVIGERGAVAMRYAARARDDGTGTGTGAGAGAAVAVAALREALADELRMSRATDVRRGMTHSGPHRDDLLLTIDGRALQAFGSSGQQRTVAIALRVLEARTMRVDSGRSPVLLLDDPFAELDEGRARAVLQLVRGSAEDRGQVILVVPRADDIPAALDGLDRWRISGGVLERSA
jgi:DNA replication and repair protein RecF